MTPMFHYLKLSKNGTQQGVNNSKKNALESKLKCFLFKLDANTSVIMIISQYNIDVELSY